jgi:hypothetical protein
MGTYDNSSNYAGGSGNTPQVTGSSLYGTLVVVALVVMVLIAIPIISNRTKTEKANNAMKNSNSAISRPNYVIPVNQPNPRPIVAKKQTGSMNPIQDNKPAQKNESSTNIIKPKEDSNQKQINSEDKSSNINVASTIGTTNNLGDQRCNVHFINKSKKTIIVFDASGNKMFTIYSFSEPDFRMNSGQYFYAQDNQTGQRTSFTVERIINQSQNLLVRDVEFSSATNIDQINEINREKSALKGYSNNGNTYNTRSNNGTAFSSSNRNVRSNSGNGYAFSGNNRNARSSNAGNTYPNTTGGIRSNTGTAFSSTNTRNASSTNNIKHSSMRVQKKY